MNIALLGYGKMGKAIEKIALSRGHEIVLKVDANTTSYDISIADIAIDFSTPTVAFKNISNSINNNIPIISGTTGWYKDYDKVAKLCEENNTAFIAATNFSLGMNVFFELNKNLAKMMASLKEYDCSIEEIHHTEKLDAPSGTAITLAEGIIKNTDKKEWSLNVTNSEDSLPILAKRIPNITGIHAIKYTSSIDTLEIKHTANNREGYALGAVIAAEWLLGKKGVYTMKDVLGI